MGKYELIKCPNCDKEVYFNLDSYGYTPWHLHCGNCNINIGTTNRDVAVELLKYCKPNTYIEFYNNKIQLFMIGE